MRGRPSDSIESSSSRLAPVIEDVIEAAVGGRAACLVLVGNSFTGGVGADGSSNAGAAPSGPSGSSVTASSVVDCASVLPPCRRGVRVDLTGGFFALDVAGGELSSFGFEGVVCSVVFRQRCTSGSQACHVIPVVALFLSSAALARLWFEDERDGTSGC